MKARVETGQGALILCFPNSNSLKRRENAKAGYVYYLYRSNHSRWLFGLYPGADVAVVPLDVRTYNPKKGCKDLTQRRKGVEKARKENHFKKARIVTLCVGLLISALTVLV